MSILEDRYINLLQRYIRLRHELRNEHFFLAHILGYDRVVALQTPHHEEALKAARTTRFVVIEFPRDTYKTTVFTIIDTIRDVINDPNTRQLVCHFAGALARAMLDEIGNHFLVNDYLRFAFPDICPINAKRPETGDWSQDSITVRRTRHYKESTIHALGSDMAMASYHFDRIRFDDLVVDQSTTTVDQINKATSFLKKSYSLLNIHDPNVRMSVVGTQWAPDDTMVQLEQGKILAPDGEPFRLFKVADKYIDKDNIEHANFPDILSLDILKGLEKSQGGILYSAFYKLDSVEVLGALWAKQHIQYYNDIPDNIKLRMIGSLDPAISDSDNKNNCDTALPIVGLDQNNEIWILDYKLSKGLNDVYTDIFDLFIKWKNMTRVITKPATGIKVKELLGDFRYFVLETTLFQKLISKQLRIEMQKRDIWVPIRENNPHTDKTKRIMVLDNLIRSKAFHMKPSMNELESQIIRFGRPNSKVDLLDAIAQAYSSVTLTSKITKKSKENYSQEYEDMWRQAHIV